MPLTRILGFGISIVMVVTVLSSVSPAQARRPLRWLGQGFSDGYHRCTPGPNSDYYNPYSTNNSLLISKNPAAAYHIYPNGYRATGIKIGVPFSVYASPPANNDVSVPNQNPDLGNFVEPSKSGVQPGQGNSNKPGEIGEIVNGAALVPRPNGQFQLESTQFDYSRSSSRTLPVATVTEKQVDSGINVTGPLANEHPPRQLHKR